MKQLFTIFSLFQITFSVYAQNNIFVLVDVSKSVTQPDLNNAKQALTEVLTGSSLTNAQIYKGASTDLIKFKMSNGDKLSIAKFGSCQTTTAISPSQSSITNVASDVSSVLNSISWIPTDNNTFIVLAKAKIAEYAKANSITNYKLCIITDNIQTDFSKGKLTYCSDAAKDLAESYNSGSNSVTEGVYTKLKFNSNSDFTISFIQNVDVSKYTLPGGNNTNPPPPPPPLTGTPSITLTSFADGKKEKPKPTNSNSFTISWTCNCPTGTTFNVSLTEIDGGKFRDPSKKNIQGNSVKYTDIPSGKFKIAVTASNVNTAFTFVETPSGGYGLIIFLLFLIVAGAVGYYFWNKKRQEKIDVFATNKADDIFSKGSGGTSTGNSSKTDYF